MQILLVTVQENTLLEWKKEGQMFFLLSAVFTCLQVQVTCLCIFGHTKGQLCPPGLLEMERLLLV